MNEFFGDIFGFPFPQRGPGTSCAVQPISPRYADLQQHEYVRHDFCIIIKYAYVANLPYTLYAGVPGLLLDTVLGTGNASSRLIHLVARNYHTYKRLVITPLS